MPLKYVVDTHQINELEVGYPRFYHRAYDDFETGKSVFYPVGLNVIISFLHWLDWWCAKISHEFRNGESQEYRYYRKGWRDRESVDHLYPVLPHRDFKNFRDYE
jgi:hypothetical protein